MFAKRENLTIGNVIANKDSKEVEEIIREEITKDPINKKIASFSSTCLTFYTKNKDIPLSDDYVNFLYKNIGFTIFAKIIKNMTLSQITMLEKHINASTMVESDLITIPELNRIKGGNGKKNINLQSRKFVREEDIIANPNLFDPSNYADSYQSSVYMTESTFNKLNIIWNKRLTYNMNLMSFKSIMSHTDIGWDDIQYLMNKTKASDSDFIAGMRIYRIPQHREKEFRNIKILKHLLETYS